MDTNTRIAILVGINAYPFSPLDFSINDVTELRDILAFPEYEFKVKTILDEEATKKTIKSSLEAALNARPGFLIFYFSGHGSATDLGSYLDTVDAEEPDDGIPLEYLRKLAEVRAKGCSILYILDCCHAGSINLPVSSSISTPLQSDDITRELGAMGGEGRAVLASCKAAEFSRERKSLKHSLFTSHLLEGLLGDAADPSGEITVNSIYDYISLKFRDEKLQLQTPVFRGDLAGRLVIGHGFKARKRTTIDEHQFSQAESEGRRHLDGYNKDLTTLRENLEYWRLDGFKRASSSLEPIENWFTKQEYKYPELKDRPAYQELIRDLRDRRRELASLSLGTMTSEGEVDKMIGRGGFGSVWKIGSKENFVAYKVFHAQYLDEPERVSRFKRGFEAMQMLDHPCIIKVTRFTSCPLGYFMDFLDGPNLRHFVGTLEDPVEIIEMLITIGETLNHAHGRGVVHRDLKPENIIMTFEVDHWRAHLTDFDLAWFSTASQLTRTALGALYYASPEQLNNPGSPSARAKTTDIYSFGQLMYFSFCGSDPTTMENLRVLQGRIKNGWVEEAARKFSDLYANCTILAPLHRPRDFRTILDELASIRAILKRRFREVLSTDSFVRELAFSLVGLQATLGSEPNSFGSLSGKESIAVTIQDENDGNATITYSICSLETPVVAGASHQKMRELLLSRVGRAIETYTGVSRRAGNQLPFQVYLTQTESLNLDGVQRSAALLGRVLDAISSPG